MGRQVSQMNTRDLGPNAFEDGTRRLSTMLQSKTGESVMIQDSPDAIKNMKSVFMRLCQSSKEQISDTWQMRSMRDINVVSWRSQLEQVPALQQPQRQRCVLHPSFGALGACAVEGLLRSCGQVSDVVKVHNLLGEPIDEDEDAQLMDFFKATSKSTACITFDMFMRWWSELHDSSADPDQYYSNERYRQRFKVLHSRLKDPKLAQITAVKDPSRQGGPQHHGTVDVLEGDVTSRRFRVWFECDGTRLSPWHDIPLRNADGSYNFVCEIPKWTRKKYEIATGEAMNPIKQDVKNGVLREYKWGDMLFNYGAFPQTWEDPKHVSEDTGCPGDNDPVDVIELGSRQRPVGSITAVKNMHDLGDVDAHFPGMTAALTDWLRMYKTAEGKKENKFGFGGKPQGAAFARKIDETHESWRKLMAAADEKGKVKKVASGNNLFTDLALGDDDD
eukprot:g6549.t1